MSTATQKAIEALEEEIRALHEDRRFTGFKAPMDERIERLHNAIATLRTEQPKRHITMQDVRLGCGEIGREAAIVAEWILKRWQPTIAPTPNAEQVDRIMEAARDAEFYAHNHYEDDDHIWFDLRTRLTKLFP